METPSAAVSPAPVDAAEEAQSPARWSRQEVLALFELPFNDLLHRAHETHRRHHDPNRLQLSSLINIKTGGCQEDCKYCNQSAKYDTGLAAGKLIDRDDLRTAALAAKAAGASRFCMGAAWRELKDRDLERMLEIIADVKALEMETCMTLGMLTAEQARRLKEGGLDYYNHNLDTSREYYGEIVSTRSYQDRLETLDKVRAVGIKVCCGGIIGMGEARQDRASMLHTLATLEPPPESVPINLLVPVPGTPLAEVPPLDVFEFIRTIAVARILMPRSAVRLSAGRRSLTDEAQALCFFAGANSIFYGEQLLTTVNSDREQDQALFTKLGLKAGGAGSAR